MAAKQSPELQVYALMGVCLLHIQLAERVLSGAIKTVLRDRTLTTDALNEPRSLGEFLKDLRKHTWLDSSFDQKLRRFLKLRNVFIHNFNSVPGLDFHTEEGRTVADEFLIELLALAIATTGVFMSVFTISAKEELGEDLTDGNALMTKIEGLFGPTAKQILARKNRRSLSR